MTIRQELVEAAGYEIEKCYRETKTVADSDWSVTFATVLEVLSNRRAAYSACLDSIEAKSAKAWTRFRNDVRKAYTKNRNETIAIAYYQAN